MPLTRYQVRNEYSLADPELYRAADKDDPEALLEGVAMAGLVGVLRQLGDLAEFAAEIFHDLHEEVMVTAARGHTLMVRVQQLESEFPPIEKDFLSQTSHSTFFSNSGIEWHPNLQMNQNLITKGDLPRFVMDSYEEARAPPRLFLLDKFDIAGAGSCLKRYTDPSFFKVEASFLDMASADIQRDKKFRKAKKKGPRWKHGETPEILPSIKLHQLFLEERVESGASDPARLVKLKRKSSASALGSENGKSYMEKFLNTPPEDKMVHEVSVESSPLKLSSKSTTGSGHEIQILDVSNVGSDVEPTQRIRGPYPPPSLGRTIVRPSENDFFEDIVEEQTLGGGTSNPSFDDKDIAVDEEIKLDEKESYHSDCDDASEIDNYMDALATMESEVETDTEFRAKREDVGFLNIEKRGTDSDPNDEQLHSQSQFSDSQSIGNFTASESGNSSRRKGVSSFSCSEDTASTSAEDTPSTEIGETEVTCRPSNQNSTIEKVRVDQLPEHEASDNACTELAETHASKASLPLPADPEAILVEDDKSGEFESDDASSDANEILSDPEERLTDDRSEISSGPMKANGRAADENGEISGGPPKTEEQMANVDGMLQTRDEITPTLSYEEHLENTELEDSYVDSCTVIDTENILEEIHENEGSENSFEDVVQTKFAEDVSARKSVDTPVMSPDSVISHPEEQPSVLHLEGQEGKANDDLSDKFDSAEIGLVYSQERDLDQSRDGKISRDSESDVEETEPPMNLVERDFVSEFSESQDPPSLADNHSQSEEREDKMVQTEDEVERARNSSLSKDHTQSDERENEIVKSQAVVENAPVSSLAPEAKVSLHLDDATTASTYAEGNEQILESESPRFCSLIEETDVMSSDCIPVLSSWEEKVEPETNQLDLQPLDIAAGSDLSSQLEPIDSPNHMNHKTDSNADVDSSSLTVPTQPLEQEKAALQVEELHVGPLLVGEVTRESSQSNPVEWNETDPESWPGPISGETSVSEHQQSSNHTFGVFQQVETPLTPASGFPGFNLLPEVAQLNLEEMPPPLPPLPPMQWRIGKLQHASVPSGRDDGQQHNRFPPMFPSIHNENMQASNPFPRFPPTSIANFSRHEVLAGNMVNSAPFLSQMPTPNLRESQDDLVAFKETQSSNPFAAVSATYSERPQHAGEGVVIQPSVDHSGSRDNLLAFGQRQSSNPFAAVSATYNEMPQHAGEGEMIQPTVDHSDIRNDFGLGQTQSSNPFTALPETCNEMPHQASPTGEGEMIQPTDDTFTPAITPGPTSSSSETPNGESTQSPDQLLTEASVRKEAQDHTSVVSEMPVVGPPEDSVPHPPVENRQPRQPEHVEPTTEEETGCSSSTSALPSVDDEKPNAVASVDNEKPNGNRIPKLPRPRSPLIEAVAAHDKSKLRKVTERVRPQEQKGEERDSILDQIRTKSFNLKPAVATRPTIQGPRTNLRVAAILEKANAIRQAFAGSDDDSDEDWSE